MSNPIKYGFHISSEPHRSMLLTTPTKSPITKESARLNYQSLTRLDFPFIVIYLARPEKSDKIG